MSPRDSLKPNKRDGKIEKVCVGCGKIFKVHLSSRHRYCSKGCMKKIVRVCVDCGRPFEISKKSKRRNCGNKCPVHKIEYDCIICHRHVERPRCFGMGRFCSNACRLTHSGVPMRNGIHREIRKGDLIDPQDIYDFYDWICICCDEYIDPHVKWPDPGCATLDHVIPLSRGGTHTWDNVAPAHLLCNGLKADIIDKELIERHSKRWNIERYLGVSVRS